MNKELEKIKESQEKFVKPVIVLRIPKESTKMETLEIFNKLKKEFSESSLKKDYHLIMSLSNKQELEMDVHYAGDIEETDLTTLENKLLDKIDKILKMEEENEEVRVKFTNTSMGLPTPEYKTEGSAGMDLYANLKNDLSGKLMIKPMERVLIKTGISIELPKGYEAQIRPRSGLALNDGLTVLNTPGTIDSDYRGEIGVILINLSNYITFVNHGDRIAQMVISRYEKINLIEDSKISETDRGQGGFGSTGK